MCTDQADMTTIHFEILLALKHGDLLAAQLQRAIDIGQRKRIRFIGDAHQQTAHDRQGQRQLQLETGALAGAAEDAHRTAYLPEHVGDHIQPDPATRNIGYLFAQTKTWQQQKLQQLGLAQACHHFRRDQLARGDGPTQLRQIGAGVDLAQLRRSIASRKLVTPEVVARLSETELLEFLLLPGFSLRKEVTDISGRGVGLDVVADMLRQVRGTVRIFSSAGQGTRFQLQLPLTLSVMRSLLVGIADEPYAFPLAYVNRTLELRREQIAVLEGKQYFEVDGRHVGLISAHQILQQGELRARGDAVMVVVIGDHEHTYGVAVDRFLGERMLVVQALDARLGKIPNIQAGALMEDGAPLLILDVADMLRSVEKLSAAGQLESVQHTASVELDKAYKRVLVVDDSLTVRELERKLLSNRGYQVVVAVDGMDGWNAVRTEPFDLVITDIDMPRMDGIELVTLIRQTPHLRSLPVMIVSYKDRQEDRQRGLEAGADYYFAKSSFHDESLLQAVVDLIGVAET